MIGYLRGRRLALEPESLVLDVNGVGYAARIPMSTYFELEKLDPDDEIGLFVHTHVRADAIELFGFRTEAERTLFEHLLGVGGVGPRLAQVVLSGGSTRDLLNAIGGGNVAVLTRIPGIGRKTAERMVLELREKAKTLLAEAGAEPGAGRARARPGGRAGPGGRRAGQPRLPPGRSAAGRVGRAGGDARDRVRGSAADEPAATVAALTGGAAGTHPPVLGPEGSAPRLGWTSLPGGRSARWKRAVGWVRGSSDPHAAAGGQETRREAAATRAAG